VNAILLRTPFRQVIRGYAALLNISGALSTLAESARSIEQALAASQGVDPNLKSAETGQAAASPTPVEIQRFPIAGRDLVCKRFDFPEQSDAFLVLPQESDDPVVSAYLQRQELNAYMLEVLSETTSADDQVIDLGCHVGTFSIGASAMRRRVISVDASQFHIALVGHSKDINRFAHLQLQYAAISQREGTVWFDEDGLFGAVDFLGHSSRAVETPAMGLDRIAEEHAVGAVKFLKMDIEGAEYDAILTGKRMIARDHPVIWYESNGPTLSKAGKSISDLRSILESYGYRSYRIEGPRWIYAPPGQLQPEMWVDMIALSAQDQAKYAARICNHWQPDEILQKCREWAASPHESARRYLQNEINSHRYDPEVTDTLLGLASDIERDLMSREPQRVD